MKAKDARKELEKLAGNELYKRAGEMYDLEIDQLVEMRSHGKKPTVGVVESAVKQVADWFRKVYPGLAWEDEKIPLNIIEWSSGEAYVRYDFVDPKLVAWGKRTRRAVLKGTPLPMLDAMDVGDLDAASSMMMAMMRRDVKRWGELEDKRKAFAEKYGVKRCPYEVQKKDCEHQTTYVMELGEGQPFPATTADLVFVCALDKCVEEEET